MNTKDSYDPELCRAVLEFALAREDEVIARPEPLIALPGFSWAGREFDAVGRIGPEAHRLFPNDPELNSIVFGVFPAYSCEISGFESIDQAADRYGRMLNTSDISREPSPYALVRFDNPKTGAGTIGNLPVFVSPGYLAHELRLLEGAEGAFLELQNYRNGRWLITWNGQWQVSGDCVELYTSSDEVIDWAMATINR